MSYKTAKLSKSKNSQTFSLYVYTTISMVQSPVVVKKFEKELKRAEQETEMWHTYAISFYYLIPTDFSRYFLAIPGIEHWDRYYKTF